MTHNAALTAALTAARAYQTTLRPPVTREAPIPAAPDAAEEAPGLPDSEALACLTAPAVSRLIARAVRERRLPP